jgi:C1A family cysteine protease
MQHISHIFIGEDLISLRDQFASTYRRLHADLDKSLFSALSLTVGEDEELTFCPDEKGETLDGATINKGNRRDDLTNFFNGLFDRKITVGHPGNQSLVIILWVKLYNENIFDIIRELSESIKNCTSRKIFIEIAGFTHDAVSCFISNPKELLSPSYYQKCFKNNIAKLREIRQEFSACKLISNRNMSGVALDLNEKSLARICSEYSALMSEHYLDMRRSVIDSQEYPFESFGVSSIIFDLQYYKSYIRNRILIDTLLQEGIDNRLFNINALAQKTNPLLKETIDEIHNFYNKQVTEAKASLSSSGTASASDIVGTIDDGLKNIVLELRNKVDNLLANGSISTFESEALLSLILGNDCSMFDTSAVKANEIIVDDIIDESAQFFINLDSDDSMLNKVTQDEIKQIRNKIRNIAVANRKREDRLNTLNIQRKDSEIIQNHIDGNEYHFGNIGYKLDLTIDVEPLEHTYEPHEVKAESIDLRNIFGAIRDQGRQGSCSSFAVASVIEALRRDSKQYSPAFLYWNARQARNDTDKDTGASLYGIIKVATDKGSCPEELMPYNPSVYTVSPSDEAVKEAMDCRVLEAKTVELKLDDIKSALADGYPVIVAAQIFDSFSDTRSGFIQHPSSEEISNGDRKDGHGRHAMVVCGFSDRERVLVVRNSWGTRFGENGYCYIPYSYAQQYFLQACIITKVSTKQDVAVDIEKKTINFNLADNNIEAAILQNLIAEDNYELNILKAESDKLRTAWAQNIAILGNVNNQDSLIQKNKEDLKEKIENEKKIQSQLQSSEDTKIKEFKKGYLRNAVYICLGMLITWLIVFFFPSYSVSWIIAAIITTIFVFFAANYAYRWRKYRQELRDEIQHHAHNISYLKEQLRGIEIKAHIHGSILCNVYDYKLTLLDECLRLKSFNKSLTELYKICCKEHETMTPSVPYPFIAVLDNDKLDLYYTAWRDKMSNALNLRNIFARYSIEDNLVNIINEDEALNKAITRGLRNFNMREYITMNNRDKWQFLPDVSVMSETIPNLDSRAIPFCTYNTQSDVSYEKYIFIKDVTDKDMSNISRFFSQAPQAIPDSNPYAISILNIVRYKID